MSSAQETGNMDLHEAALEGLPLPVIVHDIDMIIYANPEACRALGARDRTELEGLPISSIVHPDGREAGLQRRKLLLESGGAFRDVAVKLIDLRGSTLYLTGSANTIVYCGRPAILFVGTRTP